MHSVTREHKLALIVGFSLVLVLGVLLSDHFSKARNIAPPAVVASTGQAGDFGGSDPMRQSRGFGGPGTVLPPTVPQPGKLDMADIRDPMNQKQVQQAVTPVPQQQLQQPQGRPSTDIAMGSPQSNNNGGGMSELAGVRADPIPAPANPNNLPVSREPLRRHEVREGDSAYRLAQQTYNDGKLWEKIRDYPGNKGRIGENGAMREGATILLPPKDVLLGTAILAEERVGGPSTGLVDRSGAQAPATPAEPAKTDAKTTSYTVKSGDTLAEIARKKLGSVARVQDIIDLNRSTMPDPDALKVGMTLKLPTR